MERGWSAAGRLRPLWEQLPGKSQGLADLTGISRSELSSYNNGKPLGVRNADRIIEGFAKGGISVSRLELGAPVHLADERGLTLLDRLREVEELVSEGFARLEAGIARVEKQLGGAGASGSRP